MALIPLHQGGQVVVQAQIDDSDYERFAPYRWHLTNKGYACRYKRVDGRPTALLMHREVVGLKPHAGKLIVVDHLNRDKLDNRSANLEIVTSQENRRRSRATGVSGVKGVYWSKSCGRWNARLDLGHFDTVEAAAAALEELQRAAAGT